MNHRGTETQREHRGYRLYTDGGVIKKNPSPYGGTWAFVLTDENGNVVNEMSGLLTNEQNGQAVTNNVTELYAVTRGVILLPDDSLPVHIYTDSRVTQRRVFNRNASLAGVPEWLRLDLNCARTVLKARNSHSWDCSTLLAGHPSLADLKRGWKKNGGLVSPYNVRCDALCNEEAKRFLASLPP